MGANCIKNDRLRDTDLTGITPNTSFTDETSPLAPLKGTSKITLIVPLGQDADGVRLLERDDVAQEFLRSSRPPREPRCHRPLEAVPPGAGADLTQAPRRSESHESGNFRSAPKVIDTQGLQIHPS